MTIKGFNIVSLYSILFFVILRKKIRLRGTMLEVCQDGPRKRGRGWGKMTVIEMFPHLQTWFWSVLKVLYFVTDYLPAIIVLINFCIININMFFCRGIFSGRPEKLCPLPPLSCFCGFFGGHLSSIQVF